MDSFELLDYIRSNTIPENWNKAKNQINEEENFLNELLNQRKTFSIYGVNTMVGHLDDKEVTSQQYNSFQRELIKNHDLSPIEDYYSDFTVKCINYCKINTFSLGGSAISLSLYNKLVTIIKNEDFLPQVPKSSSYSCGDVIPASAWANKLCEHLKNNFGYELKRKEGLSLINGNFIQQGVALSLLEKIKKIWLAFVFSSKLNALISNANQSNYTNFLTTKKSDSINIFINLMKKEFLKNNNQLGTIEKKVQDPISIRGFPQISSSIYEAIKNYISSLDILLFRRSDNPLISIEDKDALSQASFLAPQVSLAVSQLIEAVLLAMWTLERRLQHLLSGNVENIPINGIEEDKLGFIQAPKLVTSLLEESRSIAGRRTFASGGSTSYGVEDIWNHGLHSLDILSKLCNKFKTMIAIEIVILKICNLKFYSNLSIGEDLNQLVNSDHQLKYKFKEMEKKIVELNLPIEDIPPFDNKK